MHAFKHSNVPRLNNKGRGRYVSIRVLLFSCVIMFLSHALRADTASVSSHHGHDHSSDSPSSSPVVRDASSPSDSDSSSLYPPFTCMWWLTVLCSMTCVSVAALAAGLTIGLLSIEPFDLEIIQATDENDCHDETERQQLRKEKQYASKLMPLVHKHHLLLVTLLLMNSISNEALPLFLDRLVPSYLAVLLSVTFVLVFGEILPSAVFTGAAQLRLAAALTPLVWVTIVLFFPIAKPIAFVLDRVIGEEEDDRYRRGQLKALVALHTEQTDSQASSPHSSDQQKSRDLTPLSSSSSKTGLTADEVSIIHGALELKNKIVSDVMIPEKDMFMLSHDDVLDTDMLASLLAQGHSRIPVYEGSRSNVRGVLLVKRLIVLNPEDKRRVGTIASRWPMVTHPQTPLLDMLNRFQSGRSHLSLVCSDPDLYESSLRACVPIPPSCVILGLVTLEDILEVLLKEEIEDETDQGVRRTLQDISETRKRMANLRILTLNERHSSLKLLHKRSMSTLSRSSTVQSLLTAKQAAAGSEQGATTVIPPASLDSTPVRSNMSYGSVDAVVDGASSVNMASSTQREPSSSDSFKHMRSPSTARADITSPSSPSSVLNVNSSPVPPLSTQASSFRLLPRASISASALSRPELSSKAIMQIQHRMRGEPEDMNQGKAHTKINIPIDETKSAESHASEQSPLLSSK